MAKSHITLDELLYEIDRLTLHVDQPDGMTMVEFANMLGINTITARKLVRRLDADGRITQGRKMIRCWNGRAYPADCFTIQPAE